jgi:arsenate reductase (thioredoxin)
MSTPVKKIAFVCLHGSAKSLIAAEFANRLAKTRGIAAEFSSAGTEPDPAVPPHVVEGLRGDGIDVSHVLPRRVTEAALAGSSMVVSFGPNVEAVAPRGAAIETWDNLPNVDAGYGPARDAIRARVEALLTRL